MNSWGNDKKLRKMPEHHRNALLAAVLKGLFYCSFQQT